MLVHPDLERSITEITVPGDPDIRMQLETHVKVDFFANCEGPYNCQDYH